MSPSVSWCDNAGVSLRRIYGAGFVLGLSVAAAVWLLTYRVWTVFQYIGLDGRHFHSSEHVKVTPWWSVPAAVAVMLAGAEISLWLLPGGRGLVSRLADHWVKVARRVQNRPADGVAE
jgi:hypothetical protein